MVHGAGRRHPQPPTIHDLSASHECPLLAYLGWWCWGGGWNHNSHPPPYLRSLRVAEFRICRCPAGVGILRILLICVSVVEGKRRGEIQNSPEKGLSKKLTKDILFSRDKHPGFPSQGSLGLESCLLVRDPHRQPYPLIQHRADCEVFWMCPVV